MKKLILLISIFLLAAATSAQSTWPVFINGIYYNESNGEAVVVSGEYPDGYPTGTIVIPDHITVNNQDYPVTTLNPESLVWIRNGQILVLPPSITAIDYHVVGEGAVVQIPEDNNIMHIFHSGLEKAQLPETIHLPEIKTLGAGALCGTEPSKAIVLGPNLSILGDCFGESPSIRIKDNTDLNSTGSTLTIGKHALNCILCKEFRFPTKAHLILGDEIATGCKNLERVVFPDIREIEYDPIARYDDFASITTVCSNLFTDCAMLKEAVCLGSIPPEFNIPQRFFDGGYVNQPTTVFRVIDNCENCTLKVPAGSEELYRAHPVWGLFKHIVGFENGDYTFDAIDSPDFDTETPDSTPRYFNLQGIEVNRPANGDIYIRRTGTKTQKIIF